MLGRRVVESHFATDFRMGSNGDKDSEIKQKLFEVDVGLGVWGIRR